MFEQQACVLCYNQAAIVWHGNVDFDWCVRKAWLHACGCVQFMRPPQEEWLEPSAGITLRPMLYTCGTLEPLKLACTRIESFVSGCGSLLPSSSETRPLSNAAAIQSSEVPGCELF